MPGGVQLFRNWSRGWIWTALLGRMPIGFWLTMRPSRESDSCQTKYQKWISTAISSMIRSMTNRGQEANLLKGSTNRNMSTRGQREIRKKLGTTWGNIDLSSSDASNEICLVLVECSPVWMEHVVEPDLGNWISWFRPPGIVCLSPSKNESPRDGPNFLVLKNWQVGNELWSCVSGHILSTYWWSAVSWINPFSPLFALMAFSVHVTSQ